MQKVFMSSISYEIFVKIPNKAKANLLPNCTTGERHARQLWQPILTKVGTNTNHNL